MAHAGQTYVSRRGLLAAAGLAPLASRRRAAPVRLRPMAEYRTLGATIPIAAVADTTGLNSGNLTTTVDLTTIGNAKVGQAEIYHMTVRQVPGGGQAQIKWNTTRDFGFTYPNVGSEWWGLCYMRPGDQLLFLWNIADTVPASSVPMLTAWWRYDITLPENAP